jgi:hypothetical protein
MSVALHLEGVPDRVERWPQSLQPRLLRRQRRPSTSPGTRRSGSWRGKKSLENGDPLKEYTIGVEALGKPTDYDPRLDPTVRVDISKLRAKLREY